MPAVTYVSTTTSVASALHAKKPRAQQNFGSELAMRHSNNMNSGERAKTLSAIRHLERELEPLVNKATEEMQTPKTRTRGKIRMDLIQECRRRLFELSCVAKATALGKRRP